jgi:peptidoglycan/xylan/chitin deacetylase (PgdA/CDA1 family)
MRQVPELVKQIWRTPVWRIKSSEKALFITFDDGPNPYVTPQILEILDAHNAKATFFCVGENVKKYSDVFEMVKSKGHNVGNHTYSHLKGTKTTTKEYIEDTKKANNLIQSKLFRPPYGKIKFRQINQLKKDFNIILWDFITYDYNSKKSPDEILKEIKKRSRNGSIVVFHDSEKAKENVLTVLPLALEFWKKKGYAFKTIEKS